MEGQARLRLYMSSMEGGLRSISAACLLASGMGGRIAIQSIKRGVLTASQGGPRISCNELGVEEVWFDSACRWGGRGSFSHARPTAEVPPPWPRTSSPNIYS
jgi:hypothetical protein